jgi:hypothetical protein
MVIVLVTNKFSLCGIMEKGVKIGQFAQFSLLKGSNKDQVVS